MPVPVDFREVSMDKPARARISPLADAATSASHRPKPLCKAPCLQDQLRLTLLELYSARGERQQGPKFSGELKGNDYGVDNPDPCRNLHRSRDQRLSAGRVLIAIAFRRDPTRMRRSESTCRHRARCRGRRGLSTMELPVFGLPARLVGGRARQTVYTSQRRRLG